ncbi:hypothetical protein LAUMK4_01690 [Mycobacterium persicum]|uniref:Uncharacterized protein n=1 Tax=Mycobacterium persicum TaxID=1487726 RepID=A0ABY6RFW3_9MYCO|nr:hypothetical protein LAUMK4_01690 [Mycobacterium persicum]
MPADTSSAPAANTSRVAGAAAALADVIVDPMPDTLEAAAKIESGAAIR